MSVESVLQVASQVIDNEFVHSVGNPLTVRYQIIHDRYYYYYYYCCCRGCYPSGTVGDVVEPMSAGGIPGTRTGGRKEYDYYIKLLFWYIRVT